MIDPSVAFGTDACAGRSPQAGCKRQFRNTSVPVQTFASPFCTSESKCLNHKEH